MPLMMTGLCICVLYYNVTRQRVMHDLIFLFLVPLYISGRLTGVYGPAVGFVFEPRHPPLAIWLTTVTPYIICASANQVFRRIRIDQSANV